MSLKEQEGLVVTMEGDLLETELGPRSTESQKEAGSISRETVCGAAGRGGVRITAREQDAPEFYKSSCIHFFDFPKGSYGVCITSTPTKVILSQRGLSDFHEVTQ